MNLTYNHILCVLFKFCLVLNKARSLEKIIAHTYYAITLYIYIYMYIYIYIYIYIFVVFL